MLLRIYLEHKNLILSFFLGEIVFFTILFHTYSDFITKILQYIILINIIFLIYIPIIGYFRIRYEIEKNFPFFVAFLYSLSFVSTSRKRLFEIASEAKEFGYLAKIMKKILDLATKFKLGFAEATKHVQRVVPESSFKSFLDRFSSALEVGEDLSEFFDREFRMALDTYAVSYKKSLENVRLLQDMAISFMASLSFAFVVIMLIPFLVGINIVTLIVYFVILFIATDILIYLLSKYLILEDRLLHDLPEKPKEYQNLLILFSIFSLIAVIILTVLNQTELPLLPKIAIAITPLAYVSYRTILYEREVKKKEERFPMLLNALSGLSEVMGTSQVKMVDMLRVHDFKELNKHIEDLYKRLVLSYDYFKSWFYFAVEIGSKLIARTILIFSRAIELGGNAKKIGDKLSELFSVVLDLRKMKYQFLSNARGIFYGGYIAFVAILYISLEILKLLQNLFEGISTLVGGDVFAAIGLSIFAVSIDLELVRTLIDVMVIIQAFVVALVLKNIDGGSKLGIFIDMAVLLWIASLLALGVSKFFAKFFTLNIGL